MNFLLDENVSKKLVQWLKDQGHNAITLHTLNLLGIQNGAVAELAIEKNAIILTCDRDFLQMKKNLQKQLRVIYFYLENPNFENLERILNKNLSDFLNYLNKPGAIEVTDEQILYL